MRIARLEPLTKGGPRHHQPVTFSPVPLTPYLPPPRLCGTLDFLGLQLRTSTIMLLLGKSLVLQRLSSSVPSCTRRVRISDRCRSQLLGIVLLLQPTTTVSHQIITFPLTLFFSYHYQTSVGPDEWGTVWRMRPTALGGKVTKTLLAVSGWFFYLIGCAPPS